MYYSIEVHVDSDEIIRLYYEKRGKYIGLNDLFPSGYSECNILTRPEDELEDAHDELLADIFQLIDEATGESWPAVYVEVV